jgi:RND family efflux transporter MFP subunit
MRKSKLTRLLMIALCLFPAAAHAASAGVRVTSGIEAITRPSRDPRLAFERPGRIAAVLVKPGDRVRKGQLLVRLDDAAEQLQLKQLEAQSKDETRIKAAKAQLDQKKVELKRLEEAERPPLEIDRAKLEVVIAELSLKLAEFEHTQDARRTDEARIQLERMKLLSPIDGTVEDVYLQAGESVDREKEVVRVININPLWIDVPAPRGRVRSLKVGQPAQVTFGGGGSANGKIIHIAGEGDAAAVTVKVRVEVANPEGRRAGGHVRVRFESGPAANGQGPDAP